ncbi:hypothetical protein [Rhodococcus qingshengii]|uniref:hypothetical protein n=1 Tax=Rhodococcus qingshengii TaxID=334542 RepID=UPI0036FACFAB
MFVPRGAGAARPPAGLGSGVALRGAREVAQGVAAGVAVGVALGVAHAEALVS